MGTKQERIKKIKELIALKIKEHKYYQIDRLKFLLKQAKKVKEDGRRY